MKLTADLLRQLTVGESVIITETRNGKVRGQGDVTYLFSRIKPRRFITKRLILIDPEGLKAVRCVRITRIEDWST